MYVRRCETFPR